MTNHGDDCYFFYYSTCTKGDGCPFRHCEAAMGSETVCSLWQEGRCFRTVCKFRHMEIKKNRKEIACYWETQPTGCQKPHCAFFHENPRFIEGMYIPANKGMSKKEEPDQEEPVLPPPAPLPTAANPQLRGVIKAETQENVPSPTHPPVVINAADDDEDEDDQFSEEGEDGKVGPDGTRLISPRKLPGNTKSGELNFGVSTLEEIRLRKALKASMNRVGYPLQSADGPGGTGEKENRGSLIRPVVFTARDDPVIFGETTRPRGSVADRLGKKIFENDSQEGGNVPLKRCLADRLGKIVDEDETELAPQKGLKPIRERLGLHVIKSEPAVAKSEPKKSPEQVRIKTLEEIRQEKAAKAPSQSQNDSVSTTAPGGSTAKAISSKPTRGNKRIITVGSSSINHTKTFSEVLLTKKKQQLEEEEKDLGLNKAKPVVVETLRAAQAPKDKVLPQRVPSPVAVVKVKTLEEIRKEKAARMQAQQSQEADSSKRLAAPASDGLASKKARLLRVNKASPPASNEPKTIEKTAEPTEKPVKPTAAPIEPKAEASSDVKVKSFEEIMREKRLRKQQLEDQSSSPKQSQDSASAEPAPKQIKAPIFKRTTPVRARVTPPVTTATSSTPPASATPSSTTPASTAPSSTTPASTKPSIAPISTTPSSSTQASEAPAKAPKPPVNQRLSLRAKAAVPVNNTTTDIPVAPSLKRASPPRQVEADSASCSPTISKAPPNKRKKTSPGPVSPVKKTNGEESPGPSVEEPSVDTSQNGDQKKSPGKNVEPKVRPKLNVKPSVVKPEMKVKPGQKRKAGTQSAVAAVKPLNSSSNVEEEEPAQELPKRKMSPSSSTSENQLTAAVPGSPSVPSGWGSNASPLREELQTVPVVQHSPVQNLPSITTTVNTAGAKESSVVPQSPVVKSPTQPRPRRLSSAPSRAPAAVTATVSTSAVDDFEELMNEFTGDHMEEDVDPGMGEEDLLQELSEMIDS